MSEPLGKAITPFFLKKKTFKSKMIVKSKTNSKKKHIIKLYLKIYS